MSDRQPSMGWTMPKNMTQSDSNGSTKNHMVTPDGVFEWADDRWGPFDIDVAADEQNA